MKLTGYKVKNKNALGLFAVAAIAAMFLIRYILLQTGAIDEMYTLDEEELYAALDAYEVSVSCSLSGGKVQEAGGTILDGRKISTGDEDYTLTIVTSYAAVGAAVSEEEEAGVTVTLPDSSQADGAIIAWNEEGGYALIQCRYPEELEVYYSRDILYRLDEEEPLYVLAYGEVLSGTGAQTDSGADGIGEDLIRGQLELSEEMILAGSGLYGKSGNYLGMVLRGEEDGAIYAVPGDVIMAALDAAL